MKTLVRALLFVFVTTLVSGCGGEPGTVKAPEAPTTTTPSKVAIVPGKKVQNKPASGIAD